MAQQTAVEWLIEQLAKKHNEFQALTFYYDHKDEIAQAKAMEKEEKLGDMVRLLRWVLKHYETHTDENFMFGWINPNGEEFNSIQVAEQYYNETYNK